ncbi:MAG: hypothetical protein Q8L48_07345 [Archangium sp.]|nr:hypothetical protein [Archangium sp.]
MTGTSSSRPFQVALAVIALGAFLLRVFPFFGADGAWSYRVDYDEGVYFSSAALMFDGLLPYRDFVFVHPPGLLVFLGLTSAWTKSFLGVDGAFALSRWIAAALGTINVLLVARLVLRWPGTTAARWGALFGAAFYATYPEVVQVERGPFLEPLLNLVCLSLATTVIHSGGHRRWIWVAGALAGLAVSIKLWAVLWVAGALWGLRSFATRREVLVFLGAAAVTCGLIVIPFAAMAPGNFVIQSGLFHLWRPPDGLTDRLARVEQIVALRHLASPLLALLLLGLLAARRGPAWSLTARVVVPAYVLTLLAYFASRAYWSQYNAHLIASEAVLAGAVIAFVGARAALPLRVLAAFAVVLSVFHCHRRAQGDSQHLLVARSPLKGTPDCVFTFEPGWSLAAGRLPPRVAGTAMIVDNYAHQLLEAVEGGKRFASSTEAFASVRTPSAAVSACRYVVLGVRGGRQMGGLEATHAATQVMGFEVWERR